jgi:hypothetical protein
MTLEEKIAHYEMLTKEFPHKINYKRILRELKEDLQKITLKLP